MTAIIAWIRKWAVGLAGLLGAAVVIGWAGRRVAAAKRRSDSEVAAAAHANGQVIWAESRAEVAAAQRVARQHMDEAKNHAAEAERIGHRVAAAKLKAARLREELGL